MHSKSGLEAVLRVLAACTPRDGDFGICDMVIPN